MLKKCGTFREQRWGWFIYKLKLIKQLKVAEENEFESREWIQITIEIKRHECLE